MTEYSDFTVVLGSEMKVGTTVEFNPGMSVLDDENPFVGEPERVGIADCNDGTSNTMFTIGNTEN